MARPRKEPEITYTHHINLRLTDVQYEIISENARRAELSLSEYIRRQLMKGKVIAKYSIIFQRFTKKPEGPITDFLVFRLNAKIV